MMMGLSTISTLPNLNGHKLEQGAPVKFFQPHIAPSLEKRFKVLIGGITTDYWAVTLVPGRIQAMHKWQQTANKRPFKLLNYKN